MNPELDVDSVKQRPRQPSEVAAACLRRARAVGVWRTKLPARAGIGRHDELKSARKVRDGVRAMNRNHPRFERLPQGVKHARRKLRCLVEEQHGALRGPQPPA